MADTPAAQTKLTRELVAGDELHITMPDGETFVIRCEQRDQDRGVSRSRFTVRSRPEVRIRQIFGAAR